MAETTFVETVDMHEWQTIRWGPLRAMFPSFVEHVELGRYLKGLLATRQFRVVQIRPHLEPNGTPASHVFDVYAVGRDAPE